MWRSLRTRRAMWMRFTQGITPDCLNPHEQRRFTVVTIKFPDREATHRGLGFLIGRFSGRVLRSGEVIVPEDALAALADQNFTFTVLGRTTYEQEVAALRSADSASV